MKTQIKVSPPLPPELRSKTLVISSRLSLVDLDFILREEFGLTVVSTTWGWALETMRDRIKAAGVLITIGDSAWELVVGTMDTALFGQHVSANGITTFHAGLSDSLLDGIHARKLANHVVYSIHHADDLMKMQAEA